MKISKTGFVNLIRCDRFAGLEELASKKEEGIVTFSKNMDDIMSTENLAKRKIILDHLEDDQTDDLHFKVMKPFYDEVEMLTARVVSKYFKGEFLFNMDTFKQVHYSALIDGYEFICFLDGLLKHDGAISVFESKATTTRKFLRMKYKKEEIFIEDEHNILRLKIDLGYEFDDKYKRAEANFFDKYSEVGTYVYDLAFQRYVIENSKGYVDNPNNKYYLAVLNSNYVFDGTYDQNGHPVYEDDIIAFIDLTRVTKEYMPIIEKDINTVIKRMNTMFAGEVPLGRHCQYKKTKECKFADICYKRLPEKRNILEYIGNHHGFKDGDVKHEVYDLINDGYTHMTDIPIEWLTRPNNIIQRQVIDSGEPYYDVGKIKAGIKELKYPIYHLDFESFPSPLPRFKGEKPYAQSLFQFSIHIEHAPGVCDKDKDHYSFLAKDHSDVREELIKAMLEVIKPDGGSVCVYNIAFEQTRIKELGEFFPLYKDRLFDISNRLFDLLYIVKTNTKFYKDLGYSEDHAKQINFYHEDLAGSFSIKKVLPLFSDLSYGDLDVQDGSQAFAAYYELPSLKGKDYENQYNAIVEYCKQDTWSMVKILKELREIN